MEYTTCVICGDVFQNQENLIDHLEWEHGCSGKNKNEIFLDAKKQFYFLNINKDKRR